MGNFWISNDNAKKYIKEVNHRRIEKYVPWISKKLDNMLSNINTELTFLKDNENGISVFSNKDSEW